LSLRGGFVDPDLSRGRDPNFPDSGEFFEDLPGMDRQPGFYRVSSALLLDYRDEPGNPHRGGIMGLYYSRFDDRGGSDFAFNRYGVDLRQYLPLFSDRNVLALRAVSLADEPIGNGAVPFYFQESLGGSSCLRGFRDYRFRDNKLMCMNAEFRRELGNVVELAAFYDAGKVFPDWSAFTFRQLERGYGGGFRLKTTRFVLFRLDIGRSREGTRYHVKLGRSF
jgi:outer membrane protein assembly factor BamA